MDPTGGAYMYLVNGVAGPTGGSYLVNGVAGPTGGSYLVNGVAGPTGGSYLHVVNGVVGPFGGSCLINGAVGSTCDTCVIGEPVKQTFFCVSASSTYKHKVSIASNQ